LVAVVRLVTIQTQVLLQVVLVEVVLVETLVLVEDKMVLLTLAVEVVQTVTWAAVEQEMALAGLGLLLLLIQIHIFQSPQLAQDLHIQLAPLVVRATEFILLQQEQER